MKRYLETPAEVRKKLRAIKKPGVDLPSLIDNQISKIEDLVKQYWSNGRKSESACLEVNIEAAREAIKSQDRTLMIDSLETLILFYDEEV